MEGICVVHNEKSNEAVETEPLSLQKEEDLCVSWKPR
jgi:hypothetical protein